MSAPHAAAFRSEIAHPRLSRVGLGAYPLGGPDQSGTAEATGRACFDAARDAGCTWIDTGEVYHATANEELIGRIGLHGLAIATKVAPRPAGSGLRPDEIRGACVASLSRLRVDVIDWYYLHWPDDSGVPIEDSWGAMRSLVDEGLVRSVGVSNFGIELMERCRSVGPIEIVQLGVSLVDHRGSRSIARWCGELGIPVTAYEPLANGLLAGAVTSATDAKAWAARDVDTWPFFQRVLKGEALVRTRAILDTLHEWSARLETPVAQVALGWVLAQPGVSSVLPGSRTVDHVRINAGAATLRLPSEALLALEDVASQAAG